MGHWNLVVQVPVATQVLLGVSQYSPAAQSSLSKQPADGWQNPEELHTSPVGQASSVVHKHSPVLTSQRHRLGHMASEVQPVYTWQVPSGMHTSPAV
jgi:hypothetical protein